MIVVTIFLLIMNSTKVLWSWWRFSFGLWTQQKEYDRSNSFPFDCEFNGSNMIVLTVFLLIMNERKEHDRSDSFPFDYEPNGRNMIVMKILLSFRFWAIMEFHMIKNRNENCHHHELLPFWWYINLLLLLLYYFWYYLHIHYIIHICRYIFDTWKWFIWKLSFVDIKKGIIYIWFQRNSNVDIANYPCQSTIIVKSKLSYVVKRN